MPCQGQIELSIRRRNRLQVSAAVSNPIPEPPWETIFLHQAYKVDYESDSSTL